MSGIPVGNIENWQELLTMSEDELRGHFEAALDAMSYEERSEYLRLLEETRGEDSL